MLATAQTAGAVGTGTQGAAKGKSITLAGSVSIVLEFFQFAINNILFQRGVYPPEAFGNVRKYNLSLLTTTDDGLKAYLDQIFGQLQAWIAAKSIKKLVMVISSKTTGEVLERWQFDVNLDSSVANIPVAKASLSKASAAAVAADQGEPTKTEKEIQAEIAAIMRQITASVSFLPMLNDPCTFNILVYTDKDAEVPATWVDSDPRMIARNAEQVRLRSFNTTVHHVEGLVAYRLDQDAC
ncbi:Mitotic spindle checkpoint component mad2 [Polyrhizophydium stewartii]|uniref:Mitotic spindle checkpoint component mad2 n=1 Tax=Polyrhizophydium stewartii TaxID=2732419 RepID=A0ABR4NGR3_9FUNG|nr:Mitotic spindle checkpoint component mad2 [Polyrhizophydium stewartii]